MRFLGEYHGESARQSAEMLPPFGPGFSRSVVAKLEKLQVHASDSKDPGPDFCLFEGFDGEGRLIGTIRIRGY